MPRILVVDDEPHIVDVVRAYLVREGHTVDVAGDGDAALASARANAPDVVILDVMLPRRSGFEVLRELQAAGGGAAVIMLTARDDARSVAGQSRGRRQRQQAGEPASTGPASGRSPRVGRRGEYAPVVLRTYAPAAPRVRPPGSTELTGRADLLMALTANPASSQNRDQRGRRSSARPSTPRRTMEAREEPPAQLGRGRRGQYVENARRRLTGARA